MKKKMLMLLLALVLLINVAPVEVEAKEDLRLWVDGRYVDSDSHPYIEDSRTLVPIRFIAEALGYDVDWDNATRTVIIDDGANVITMQIENKTAKYNGNSIRLNKEPAIKNGRTYVPVRDVAETLGKYVDWDQENYTVVIGKGYQGPVQSKKGSISAEGAKEIALNYAGGRIVEFESDDDEYEITIIKNGYKFDFEISKKDGAIIEIEVEYKDDDIKSKGRKPIGKDAALRIAQSIAPGRVVEFELDDGKYEIEIKGNRFEYKIEINAYDGNLLEYEREIDDDFYDDDDDDRHKNPNTINKPSKREIISANEARGIALNLVKNGRIVEFELDDEDDDDPKYEIEIIANGREYEIEIDAFTGKVLEFESDD